MLPLTFQMAPWVRKLFIDILPKYLFIQRPKMDDEDEELNTSSNHSEDSVEVKYMAESPFLGYSDSTIKRTGSALSPTFSSGIGQDGWVI